ncbi:hypothetical protein [Micromonospora taraxaci]
MTVEWSRLGHAYGRAIDTPGHLAALEFGDAEAREAALNHLDMAVLRQGFPDTATAPAVWAVTALLAEGRAHPDTIESLLEFLGDAAMSAIDLSDDRYFAKILPDLADAVEQAYPVVLPLLRASPPDRALFRAENLVAIARMRSLADRREELAVLILEWSERGAGPQAEWLHCLGQVGVDLRDRLIDPDPAVRLQAALVHEDDPRGRELILAALAEPPPPGECVSSRSSPQRSASPLTSTRSPRLLARWPVGTVGPASTTAGARWCGSRSPSDTRRAGPLLNRSARWFGLW